MIKCIIFDLDGTLLDSIEDIKDAINFSFNDFNYPVSYSREDVKHFIGHGAKDLVYMAGKKFNISNEELDLIYERYANYYRVKNNIKTKPFDGMNDTLLKLKEKGFILCVLSNKKDRDVHSCINQHFKNYFDYITGQKDNIALKPDPEMINLIIDKFHLKREEVLMVGDMHVDELTAINARIKFVGCTYGYSIKKFNTYDALINSPKELLDFLEYGN